VTPLENQEVQVENKSFEVVVAVLMKKILGTMVAVMVVAIVIGTFITSKYATAGETAKDGRFTAYDDGTVLDTRTNLMWAGKDNGADIDWKKAKSYCENYRGGGYTDWRMPTQDELSGLYDEDKSQKVECGSIPNHIATGLINLTCWWVWSSETRGPDAAGFDFDFGTRGWRHQSGGGFRALPVRSGK
jgi:hypothetical protein